MSELTRDDVVQAAMNSLRAIYPKEDYAEWEASGSLEDVRRVLAACLEILDPDDSHPNDAKKALSGLKEGYGCWTGWVRQAIERA